MKLATLKMIETLLEENVKRQEKALKTVNEQLTKLYEAEEYDTENYNAESMEYWKKSKKKHVDLYSNAKHALDDFMEHEWN